MNMRLKNIAVGLFLLLGTLWGTHNVLEFSSALGQNITLTQPPYGQYTAPIPAICTDTAVVLAPATSTPILASAAYRSVTFMNVGTNPLTFVEGSGPAVVSAGFALAAAATAGGQGGSYNYPNPPIGPVTAISTAGTTVVVKACR